MSLFQRPKPLRAYRVATDFGRGLSRYGVDEYIQQLSFSFGGQNYPIGQQQNALFQTTWAGTPVEQIPNSFVGYATGGLFSNPIVAGLEWLRMFVFRQMRFVFQQFSAGRPGDLFGTRDLGILEKPFVGGTTSTMLARALLDADLAGNGYLARMSGEITRLRPDFVQIVLAPRLVDIQGDVRQVGWRKLAYAYTEGGDFTGEDVAVFLPDEVAHFAPLPDPLASFRGMSWLTPVVREVQSDQQATTHKQKYWENAATPNLAVALKVDDPERFGQFVEKMEQKHKGASNAYKTLYTAAGADVTVVGQNMTQNDFSGVIGKGETRMALAAGIHPVVAGLSEGLQGSSLNTGNYNAAKRRTAEITFSTLWQEICGTMETIVQPPRGSRLWYDERAIAFLRDDAKDVSDIQKSEAATIAELVREGYTPQSAVAAVMANDWSQLEHTGLYSVQLQPPGAGQATPAIGGGAQGA